MTEPDEALLWAREDYAKRFRSRKSHVADSIFSGFWDGEVDVSLPAHGYRAGAAASAERIKELEAELKDTEQDLHDYSVELGRLTSALNKGHRESVLIGQQMSAERIKALEAALRPLVTQCERIGWCGEDAAVVRLEDIQRARALLKEADQ